MYKYLFLAVLCVANIAGATEKLRIFADSDASAPIYQTSDYEEVVSILDEKGVLLEKWDTVSLAADANNDTVMELYYDDVERVKSTYGYSVVDVVRMVPDSPVKVELRGKFLREHFHTEDEVRFFVEGAALFYLHLNDLVYVVHCEQSDLISIPSYTNHWFDMGPNPYFTAIRFFNDPSGWVAHYIDGGLAEAFPRYNNDAN